MPMLPDIRAFFESEEVNRKFEEWKEKRYISVKLSKEKINEDQ